MTVLTTLGPQVVTLGPKDNRHYREPSVTVHSFAALLYPAVQAARDYLARWYRAARRQRLPALAKVPNLLTDAAHAPASAIWRLMHPPVDGALQERVSRRFTNDEQTSIKENDHVENAE
jgi:hypothetical protein